MIIEVSWFHIGTAKAAKRVPRQGSHSYGEPRDFDDRQPKIFQVLWESLRNESLAVGPLLAALAVPMGNQETLMTI